MLVATVIENLEELSVEEVMEQFDVTREQITAVLEFVAQSLRMRGDASLLLERIRAERQSGTRAPMKSRRTR